MEKEFRLEPEEAAEFLRDVAESLEEGHVNLEGNDWKVSQPLDGKIPLRVFSDGESLEIGFRIQE